MDIEQFKKVYSPEIRAENSLWMRHVLRPVSYYVAAFFKKIGVGANAVTYISMAVVMYSFIFFIMGTRTSAIIGALLVNLWMLLDCTDGNLARANPKKSPYGDFVDAMGGYTMNAFVFLGIGVAAEHEMTALRSHFPCGFFAMCGGLASVNSLLCRLMYQKIVATEYEFRITASPQSNKPAGVIKQFDKNVNMSGFFLPALFIATLAGLLQPFIMLYTLYFIIGLIYIYAKFIRKVERFNSALRS